MWLHVTMRTGGIPIWDIFKIASGGGAVGIFSLPGLVARTLAEAGAASGIGTRVRHGDQTELGDSDMPNQYISHAHTRTLQTPLFSLYGNCHAVY